MTQGVNQLFAELGDLSSAPGTNMVKKRTNSYKLLSDLHISATAHMHTLNKSNKFKIL